MKLKNLEDFNKRKMVDYKREQLRKQYPPNGIACPKCAEELCDDRTKLVANEPPKFRVFCPKCGYEGDRIC